MKTSTKLPKSLYRYFWDIEPEKLNPQRYAHYVIWRILEYGNIKALSWLFKQYRKPTIRAALKGRDLSARTRTFWSCYLKHN